jgi:hypothetical protein
VLQPDGYAGVIGACGSVAEAGFAFRGGYGLMSRQLGLGADSFRSLRVVLANGGTLLQQGGSSSGEDDDLFWALRGAGGGKFGVVTEIEYQLHKTQDTQLSGVLSVSYADTPNFLHLVGKANHGGQLPPQQFILLIFDVLSETTTRTPQISFVWFSKGRDTNMVEWGTKFLQEEVLPLAKTVETFKTSNTTSMTTNVFSWVGTVSNTGGSVWENPYAQAWCGFLFPENNTLAVWQDIIKYISTRRPATGYRTLGRRHFQGTVERDCLSPSQGDLQCGCIAHGLELHSQRQGSL